MRLDRRGNPASVWGATTDVSAPIRAELDAEAHRNQLAHLSRVAMLGQLSGSIAHELNQPLTAILSNAQAALRFTSAPSVDLEGVKEILRDIVADDQRAGEVIWRLRALFERGEAKSEPLDAAALVRDVIRMLRSELISRNVKLKLELTLNLPSVHGDPVQLQQVLLNLILNACEAMANSEPAARVLLVRASLGGEREVSISVVDGGPGIAPEQIEKVFEPFVSGKRLGIGLGLAISRSIVSAHGGRLWCTNNEGARRHVHVHDPVRADARGVGCARATTSGGARRKERSADMNQEEPTVFVVDDDPSVLRSLQRLLQSAGWATETYASPEEFLRLRDPAASGCVILDVAMPGLDGFELQRRLVEDGMPLPVVFLTGYGDVPTSVRAMRAGATNFLCKPVSEERLLASVAEAVEADRAFRRDNADLVAARKRLTTLTVRERQVLDRVVAGRLNKQTADELGTALKTIKVHRARMMHKMNVKSLAQLARLVERMGVLPVH